MQVNGTVVMVTGGSSGLGYATALRLAAAGAHVVVASRSKPPVTDPDAERRLHHAPCDVRIESDVAAALDVAAELGPLRAVVSCAGIIGFGRLLSNRTPLSSALFRELIEVNLFGTFNVLQQSVARMADNEPIDGERGVVVCTSSVAAYEGQIGQVAYAASKAAVVGMTLPAARDLARDCIRVATIAPGVFETPMCQVMTPAVRTSLLGQIPHPARFGDPDEFALLGEHIIRNPMINGEVIRLDAALRMSTR